MLTELENGIVQIEPSDWRWGASIVGLSKYFDFHRIKYEIEDDYIEFDGNSVDNKRYLEFAEKHFMDRMHHKIAEELLEIDNPTEDQIKLVNEKLIGNSIMKKVVGKIKYDGNNKEEIRKIFSENRFEIIENTFREGKALYANFCNKGNLFDELGSTCRLNGYYVDKGRKIQSLSFGIDKKTFVFQDSKYFDFIPFGFSKTREAFFINNNFTIEQLLKTNKTDKMLENENVKISNFLYRVKDSAMFIDYDVEVIKKDRDLDYFETVFVRQKAIDIFKMLSTDELEILKRPCNGKKGEKSQDIWINIEKTVTENILNNLKLDDLIETLFKGYNNHKFLISHLIRVNKLIYGGENMTVKQKDSYDSALNVQNYLLKSNKKNKIKTYEQRLISSISLRDYDKVKEILLHLSAYTQVKMDFLIDVFEDFEKNKNLVYTFINTLGEKKEQKIKEGKENE